MPIKKIVYFAAIVLLSGCLLFAGSQLLMRYLEDRRAEEIYEQAQDFLLPSKTPSPADNASVLVTAPPVATRIVAITPPPTSVPEPTPLIQPQEPVQVDFDALREINNEIIGWIVIDDSIVNYPVLRANDNDKYLHMTYNYEESAAGSIFMDCRNRADFAHQNTLIYGHNMRNKSMFNTIKEFRDYAYFESRRYIFMYTPTGLLTYEVFSAYVTDVYQPTYQVIFSTRDKFETFINWIQDQSILESGVEVTADDYIITLSTCTSGANRDERFVVHGKLVQDTRVKATAETD